MGTAPCNEIGKERNLAHRDWNESKVMNDLIALRSNQLCKPKIQAMPWATLILNFFFKYFLEKYKSRKIYNVTLPIRKNCNRIFSERCKGLPSIFTGGAARGGEGRFCLCPFVHFYANFISISFKERTDIYKLKYSTINPTMEQN